MNIDSRNDNISRAWAASTLWFIMVVHVVAGQNLTLPIDVYSFCEA